MTDLEKWFDNYEKENNPFYPDDRRWDRYEVYKALKAFQTEVGNSVTLLLNGIKDGVNS